MKAFARAGLRAFLASLLATVMLITLLSGCSVTRNGDEIFASVPPTPAHTPQEASIPPTPTEQGSETDPVETVSPVTQEPLDSGDLFQKAVFIGNSCIDSLQLSGAIDGAVYLARTGLTVGQPFTKPANTGSIPIMDELNGKDYERVFLLFGENELGWQNLSAFVEGYEKVIQGVRDRLPNAGIYLLSIMPVTAAAHKKNQWMVNNDRIREFNGLIETLAADQGATFIDLFGAMVNESGAMPDELSADGIHPNAAACQVWAQTMISQLKGEAE